jgi:hypothetical protein
MVPNAWHALIDGLESEDFGVSDFFNGDARVIQRTSDVSNLPDWAQGLIWSNPSEITQIYADSAISMPWQVHNSFLEMIVWTDSAVSIGTPLYFEDRVDISDQFAVPLGNVTVLNQTDPWKPAMGFCQVAAGASEYVSVAMAGVCWVIAAATAVTQGDLAVMDVGEEVVVAPYDGNQFSAPTSGMIIGAFAESDAGASERPVRILKGLTANAEDRN